MYILELFTSWTVWTVLTWSEILMWILDLFKICFDYSRIFLGDKKKSTLQRLENCYKIFMHIFWTTLSIRIDPEWTWFVLSEYRTAVLVNFNITRVRTPKASVLEQPKLINSAGDLLRFTECSLCSNKPLRHSKNREFSIHQFLFMRSIDRQGSPLKICMPEFMQIRRQYRTARTVRDVPMSNFCSH